MKLDLPLLALLQTLPLIFGATTNNTLTSQGRGDPVNEAVEIIMNQPEVEDLQVGAWYASAAVCSRELLKAWKCKSCIKVPNTQFVEYLSNNLSGNAGYIAVNEVDRYFIVSFRGSKNPANAVTNGSTKQVRYNDIDDDKAYVHSGYLDAMESLSKQFVPILQSKLKLPKYIGYSVRVVGHSLGGAIASLASIKIKTVLSLPWEKIELYTYGQPRVGNINFARWYDQKSLKAARIVNNNDPVPHSIPTTLNSYTHHGNEFYISVKNNEILQRYCSKEVLEDPNCSYSVPAKDYKDEDHYHFFETTTGEEASC